MLSVSNFTGGKTARGAAFASYYAASADFD